MFSKTSYFSVLIVLGSLFSGGFAAKLILSNNYVLEYSLVAPLNNSMEFKIQAINATGWVGIGLNYGLDDMIGSDLFIGGWNATENKIYAGDYHVFPNGSNTRPTRDPDNAQNWEVTSATEVNGTTLLTVTRLLNSSDRVYDLDIKNSHMYLIWAFHETNDNATAYHRRNRGSVYVNLVDGSPPITPPITTSPGPSTVTTDRNGAGLIRSDGVYCTSLASVLIALFYRWISLIYM